MPFCQMRFIPPSLRPSSGGAIGTTRSARERRPVVPFRIRAEERVRAMAEGALRQCGYRRSQRTMWVGGEYIVTAYIGEPDIVVGSSSGVWRLGFHGTNGWIDVTIRLSWYSRVYRRGLAVVGGSFVLDVIAEDEKGLIVLGLPSRSGVRRASGPRSRFRG